MQCVLILKKKSSAKGLSAHIQKQKSHLTCMCKNEVVVVFFFNKNNKNNKKNNNKNNNKLSYLSCNGIFLWNIYFNANYL
jgi:hypothetical protein